MKNFIVIDTTGIVFYIVAGTHQDACTQAIQLDIKPFIIRQV